jgi:uncharacterized protein (TIGR02147 family)
VRSKRVVERTNGEPDARSPERPEVFRYLEYQGFLRDWLNYRKSAHAGFSIRSLSKQAGLAAGYLPMVLGGKRPLTGKALAKLGPFLGLGASELSFLENLMILGTTDSHDARVAALDRMKRFQLYQARNPKETEVYQYFTHWPYVAIREMASLQGFRLDPEWIQSRLRVAVPLKEIKEAIEFLVRNGFLELDANGSVRPPDKSIECSGSVYRVALTKFHRELFELAARSIENAASSERNILGHTFSVRSENFPKANLIIEEAVQRIRALGEAEREGDSVYHLEVALFPLTKKGDGQ